MENFWIQRHEFIIKSKKFLFHISVYNFLKKDTVYWNNPPEELLNSKAGVQLLIKSLMFTVASPLTLTNCNLCPDGLYFYRLYIHFIALQGLLCNQ